MNNNAILGVILGLVIGFAAGWLLSSGDETTDDSKIRRGGGSSGATPSSVVGGVPEGTWSKVGCGSGMAVEMLDDIQGLAIDALDAGQLNAPMFTDINNKLLKCAVNDGPFGGGDDMAHCAMLQGAKADADGGNWNGVLQKLTAHGH